MKYLLSTLWTTDSYIFGKAVKETIRIREILLPVSQTLSNSLDQIYGGKVTRGYNIPQVD